MRTEDRSVLVAELDETVAGCTGGQQRSFVVLRGGKTVGSKWIK